MAFSSAPEMIKKFCPFSHQETIYLKNMKIIKRPEINTQFNSQLIFNKDAKNTQGRERIASLIKMLGNWLSECRRMRDCLHLTSNTKGNSKLTQDSKL